MNYVNFIDYLINPAKLNGLYVELNVNIEFEALIICLKDSLKLDSEISIYGIEDTDGDLVFEKDGNKFIELFPLDMAQEMVEEYVNTYKDISNYEIAERLLEYRLNDA